MESRVLITSSFFKVRIKGTFLPNFPLTSYLLSVVHNFSSNEERDPLISLFISSCSRSSWSIVSLAGSPYRRLLNMMTVAMVDVAKVL